MSGVPFRITVPAGSFVKRRADGEVDYRSPLPCPFPYGEVPGTEEDDGDPIDVVVWGALPDADADGLMHLPLQGAVDFRDGGRADTKLVLGVRAPGRTGRLAILAFFVTLAAAKRARARLAGTDDAIDSRGWLDRDQATERLQRALERGR